MWQVCLEQPPRDFTSFEPLLALGLMEGKLWNPGRAQPGFQQGGLLPGELIGGPSQGERRGEDRLGWGRRGKKGPRGGENSCWHYPTVMIQ